MIPSVLRDIEDEILTPLPQNESLATYCTKISKKDALIDPTKNTAAEIRNKFRAFISWPGIYMIHKGKRLKLLEITKYDGDEKLSPGKLVFKSSKLLLGTKNGILDIIKLQPEGKTPLSQKEFANGFL